MNAKMHAAWRKMTGMALLWAALAALVYLPTADDGDLTTAVAVLGFAAFTLGLTLFADGLKREIVGQLQTAPTTSGRSRPALPDERPNG